MKNITEIIVYLIIAVILLGLATLYLWHNLNIYMNCDGVVVRGALHFECIDSKLLQPTESNDDR